MSTRIRILAGCFLSLALTGGCSTTKYFLYLVAPGGSDKVPAEFSSLSNKTIAIVIYSDQAVQCEYPYARLGLASVLAAEFKNRVKGVSLVEPRRIVQYQMENLHWDTLEKTKLGRAFGADYVLYIVLEEYSMREVGSVNLFRGRIAAQASLYDTARPEQDCLVWNNDNLRVKYPPHAPGEVQVDESKIRYETHKRFSELLVKKFYSHRMPEQP